MVHNVIRMAQLAPSVHQLHTWEKSLIGHSIGFRRKKTDAHEVHIVHIIKPPKARVSKLNPIPWDNWKDCNLGYSTSKCYVDFHLGI
jgi:hypothetical protein